MKRIKIYKLNSSNSSNSTEHSGNINDPFTWNEFITMYHSDEWEGGYVEGRGYIPKYINVVGSSIMIIDGISEGESSYYSYSSHSEVNETLHHTHLNSDGTETELTDITVKATIDLYRMTIKVDITKKYDHGVCSTLVSPIISSDCRLHECQNLDNQLVAKNSKCCSEITIDLPYDSISLPSISLDIYCNYTHDSYSGNDTQHCTILPQY